MRFKIIITFLLMVFFALSFNSLKAQSVNTEFGKNRVQYHEFEWWKYETRDFIVYWYESGRNIGETVVQLAELDHENIRSLMEYRISDRIEILVYTDLTDLKQSNIGKDDVFVSTSGNTVIVDNKMFVYFNGDHNHLREQIREGIARIYLNYMMYGNNFQEIVQNAVWLNLPEWFTEGLVSYIGDEWNTELDNQLRDGILTGKYGNFDDAVADNPRLAGHAFWYFIAENYGKSTVSNLLYLTRINRSVDNGFLYVLGTSMYRISKAWYNHYRQHYSQDANVGNMIDVTQALPIKNKANIPINDVVISPNGKNVAYVMNEIGKKRVFIQDASTGKRSMVFKNGYKNQLQETDYNYPIISWLPNSQQLAVVYEKRDDVKIYLHGVDGGESKTIDIPTKFERILSMSFIDNRRVVLTAIMNGFSDVYIFDIIGHALRPITRDYHDDLDAIYTTINGTKGIIFASNRDDSLVVQGQKLDSLLPIKTFDLYFYNFDNKKGGEIVRLTNTPLANERNPQAVNDRYFTFLSNQTGIYNRYTGYIDTLYAYSERVYKIKGKVKELVLPVDSVLTKLPADQIDTMFIRPVYKPKGFSFANSNINRNIIEQNTAPRRNQVAELIYNEGKYQVYVRDIKVEEQAEPVTTHFMRMQLQAENVSQTTETTTSAPKKEEKPKNNEPSFQLQSEFDNETTAEPDTVKPEQPKAEENDTNKIDIDNYFFQSEFEDEEAKQQPKEEKVEPVEAVVEVDKNKGQKVQDAMQLTEVPENQAPIKFRRSRITPYRTQFRSDFVTMQLDNSQLFGGMQPTVANNITGGFPPLSLLSMINVEDIFEDYRLRVGVRIPSNFSGTEYFVIFDDKTKLLDKRYEFYRSKTAQDINLLIGNQPEPYTYDLISNIAQTQLRYPLDIFQSVRATAMFRFDRLVFQAQDDVSLLLPNANEQRLGLRLEYVFDNTITKDLNILNGTRAKALVEGHNRFNLNVADSTFFEGSTGLLGLAGVDFRHYQKLDKHSILAFRFASFASFGSNKILYFLGGVNNWIGLQSNSFNNDIPISPPSNGEFSYQTVAANLRGFRSNIRNGSNFALANVELRVPVTKYFTKRNLSNNFIRNFQAVGFFDVGSAWEGFSPFREDNPLNTVVITQPQTSLEVTVNYFRNPVVFGYGFGFRSTLFGYYIKLDYAWGVETGVVGEPRTYLSIGTDF